MNKLFAFLLVSFLSFFILNANAVVNNELNTQGFELSVFKDQTNNLDYNNIVTKKFSSTKGKILNFGSEDATYWLKLKVKNDKNFKDKLIYIDQARLAIAEMYLVNQNQFQVINEINPFTISTNSFNHGRIFKLPDSLKSTNTIFLKLKAKETFLVAISILDKKSLLNTYATSGIYFGFYTGIMMIMLIYNLFLYLIIRDKSYLYYICYIFSVWITQISIQGYSSEFLWSTNSVINNFSVTLFSSLGIIFACLFTISFLNTKVFAKFWHNVLTTLYVLALINIVIMFTLSAGTAFFMMQVLTLAGAISALATAYVVYFKKHFKPAGYYLVAWSVLLVGAILFILKDYNIIPYNNFTVYLLQITSSIEVVLLSFALADKINFFKKENEVAQAQALNASLENEKLIREQNLVLEKRVQERTEELQNANSTLNIALTNLKDTQSQLVDAEKMAALGQLTAGIAHEINNPINFVTSNIKPLELDINDLKDIINRYEMLDLSADLKPQLDAIDSFKKQIDLDFVNNEINSLLAGISEGAKRTAEIIRSLRNFSRLDESDMKPIDLNEGLNSTIILIKNTIPDNVTVVKDLGNLPKVECQPGKINQVFMNLVSNAIQAIKSKPNQAEEEFLIIKSWYTEQQVKISIKDSGTGMTEEVKHRIFEPFFTTKDIGEGTGLGLSIVFSIIENHKGNIEVISKINEGTEFIITLNVNL